MLKLPNLLRNNKHIGCNPDVIYKRNVICLFLSVIQIENLLKNCLFCCNPDPNQVKVPKE